MCQRPDHTLLYLDDDRDSLMDAGRLSPPRSCSPPAATTEPLTLRSHVANHQRRQG